ncbi:MAG: hypothetical protein ACR2LQ_07660 [Acidimicrobiales bacterium]
MAALVGIVVGLGACGGSSGSGAASWGDDAASFCDSARGIVAGLSGNALTDPRGVARVAERIDGLVPPAAIADKWPSFVSYVHQLATIAPRDPDAASKALDVLGAAPSDVAAVGTYLANTCKIDAPASDLSELGPRS